MPEMTRDSRYGSPENFEYADAGASTLHADPSVTDKGRDRSVSSSPQTLKYRNFSKSSEQNVVSKSPQRRSLSGSGGAPLRVLKTKQIGTNHASLTNSIRRDYVSPEVQEPKDRSITHGLY